MISSNILAKLILSFGSFSNKELQKLSYYVFCWYLTIYKEKIANTKYEAWIHGPVSPEIYNEYKYYGWAKIPQYNGFLPLDSSTYKFVQNVVNEYAAYSAYELENMTHEEDPWINARKGCSSYESSSRVINDYDIIKYYSKSPLYAKFAGFKC